MCEGPILSLTAESCVYYRWNNLSNNDTTSGILGRRASVYGVTLAHLPASLVLSMHSCATYTVCVCFYKCNARSQTCVSCVLMLLLWSHRCISDWKAEKVWGFFLGWGVMSMCVCLYVFCEMTDGSYCHNELWCFHLSVFKDADRPYLQILFRQLYSGNIIVEDSSRHILMDWL